MDELEAFLMQDEEEVALFWPGAAATTDVNLSIDEWCGDEPLLLDGFELDFLSPLEEDDFMIEPALFVGSTNDQEEVHDLLQTTSSVQETFLPQQEQEQVLLQQQYLQEQQQQQQQEEEEVEDDKEVQSDDKKNNESNSKNFVSERNRRKRLNHQLFTLRSLVPNITKMDKRSILVDALSYLQSILQQIENEMEKNNLSNLSYEASSNNSVEDEARPSRTQGHDRYAALPALSEIDVERMDEERFILKIGCNKVVGALGQVQRAIDMLGLEITFVSVNELDYAHMQTTTILRVKKKGVATREKLLQCVRTNAAKLGVVLPPDA